MPSPLPPYQPQPPPAKVSNEQIRAYAEWIGLDVYRTDLYWLAEQGLCAPLPPNWKACNTDPEGGGEVYYFNELTGESLWDHPLDDQFRQLAKVFTQCPPADPRETAQRHSRLVAYLAELSAQAPPEPMVSCEVQVSPPKHSVSMQWPVTDLRESSVQASVAQATVGMDTMPVEATTMTSPTTHDQEASCNFLQSCDTGTVTTPGITSLRPPPPSVSGSSVAIPRRPTRPIAPVHTSLTPRPLTIDPAPQIDSPTSAPTAGMGGAAATAAGAGCPSARASTSPQRGDGYLAQYISGGGREPRRTDDEMVLTHLTLSPAAEALLKEMLSAFQDQLREHRREVYNMLSSAREEQKELRKILSAPHDPIPSRLPDGVGPLPPQPGNWSPVLWGLFYFLVFLLHLFLCFAVVLALPTVIVSSSLWEPLVEDPLANEL